MLGKPGFLLIAIAAFTILASPGVAGAAINVSGCTDLMTPDANYVMNRSLLDGNVTDQGGRCIGILAQNITLDCQGYVIMNNTLAIAGIYSNQTSTTIMNCNVSMSSESGGYGIELSGANDSLISDNVLNSQHAGLLLRQTHGTLIGNNTADSNSEGIRLNQSSGNTLANNTANSNDMFGIALSSLSDGNAFTGNEIWNCSAAGSYACIYVYESDHNVFDGNRINESSGRGIWINSIGAGDHSSHNAFRNTNMTGIAGTGVFLDDDGADSGNLNNTFLNFTYANESVDARSRLIRLWHYRAMVATPYGDGAAGVSVIAYNASGILIENLTTNGTGWTPTGELIEYVNSGGTSYPYSNYTINASHPDFMAGWETFNVSIEKGNLSDVITLGCLFSFSGTSSQSRTTWSMGIADLNNDGFLDYIAGNFNQPNSVYINNGSGSFTNTQNSPGSDATYSISVGDLNNDGFLDYIAGNHNEPNRVYLNDGDGNFSLHESSDESNATRSLIIADLDNDGFLDYIAGNSDQPNQIYINNGSGNFNIWQNSPEIESTFSIAVADLNNDGHQDYIAANYNQPDRIYINNGSGSFTSIGTTSQSDYSRTISLADMNNDGYIDLVTASGPNPKGNDRVFLNNGSGVLTLNYSTSLQDRSYGLAIADINNDGWLDFITGNAGPGKNRIYLNAGGGDFILYEDSLWSNTTNCIAVADLNNDGNLDYIAGNTGQNNIYINTKNDNDYALVMIKGTSAFVNRDAVGTSVGAYQNGGLLGYRLVTAADSSQDGSMQLHFGGLAAGSTHDINATFTTGKVVSCSVSPPVNFTVYENGTSTNGVSCYVVDFPPDIWMMNPPDGNITIDIDVNFSCHVSDDVKLSDVTIYVWNSTNDVYFSDTDSVTGTINHSSWYLTSMTPDVYMWNCLVYDNASKYYRQPGNYSLKVLVRNSLFVKLVLNNTDSMVYIPGVGEQKSSEMDYQSYGKPPHYYLASYLDNALSGLVFSMQIPRGVSAGSNESDQTHFIAVDQDMENSRLFLVYTLGNWREIESRIALIESGRFLTSILPSFSFGLGNRYSLDLALGYADIDLQGKVRLRKGTHKLVIENNGTAAGKPVVVISRE